MRRWTGRDGAPLSEDWDAICVGSGITALSFVGMVAALDPSARILVVDKHYTPGGYASRFRRRRNRFDCSLHKLSGVGEGGNLGAIFKELDLGSEVQLITPSVYFEVSFAGETPIRLANEYSVFKEQVTSLFPEERDGLATFFSELEVHGKNGYYQFQIMDGSYLPDVAQLRYAHRELRRKTVREAFGHRFRNPRLQAILAAPAIYVGGFSEDLGYLYYLHVLYATLVCGNAYVTDSSQHLSNVLVDRLEAAGGRLLLRTEVTRVLVEGDDVRGVVTNRGEFRAPCVYINAAPKYALRELLPATPAVAAVRDKALALKPSWSTTTLYLVTDVPPEECGLSSSETMLFSSRTEDGPDLRAHAVTGSDEAAYEEAFWNVSPMEVTNYHKLDPTGGRVACLNVLDTMSHWPARDTAEYARKKERCMLVLLERIYRHKPELRGHVVECELATPHTYERYTNNDAGAGYGALIGTDASAHTFHYRFPIKGVHFLSAWVAGPSYEAAFGYGRMKAHEFVKARASVHILKEAVNS